ncbi:PQQ-dependent sugar dehydrogenase [Marinicella sp. S1101]|uniref:PQQ-dependent sugar dehydrogenase n=1 Tax=Marinicella marina TaxID=2996016 RepID=UPI002260CB17|nr:PQQ-dependent sugar dehydrogenase [Marinicella marina]MCX7554549.1 PQQ-dependent sugar dehydrogenase [Marinicella marina]MDJ1141067.1 PQQ-dependent sugar dehydrogenase [Marinicella marina]
MKKLTIILATFMLLSPQAHGGEPAPLDPVLVTLESGFTNAVAVRNAGDGSNRLFVVEQAGLIQIIENGQELPTPFLNIDPLTNGGGEQGLLGLAFHPNYSQNGYFYVYYTDTDGDSVVARYSVSDNNPNVADDQSELIIIRVDQDFGNHNGGDLHFSPLDGYLYVGFGDGGSGNDPCDRGQTKDPANLDNTGSCAADGDFEGNNDSRALLGSLIRLDVDNPGTNVGDACGEGINYGIPADNPFSDANGDCGEIWAWGLRNPYRWGFDRETGDLLIGDVGQNAREEVNYQPASSSGGENYGWVCREGFIATPGISCTVANAVDPIIDLNHNIGVCSVIGGFPYRGPEDTWQGTYIYADFCTGDLYWTVQNNGVWSGLAVLADTFTNVRGFGEDEDGNLYYVSSSQVVQITDGNYSDVIFANGFE